MFVEQEDLEKIPSDFTVTFEGVSHHVYATTDKMRCIDAKLKDIPINSVLINSSEDKL